MLVWACSLGGVESSGQQGRRTDLVQLDLRHREVKMKSGEGRERERRRGDESTRWVIVLPRSARLASASGCLVGTLKYRAPSMLLHPFHSSSPAEQLDALLSSLLVVLVSNLAFGGSAVLQSAPRITSNSPSSLQHSNALQKGASPSAGRASR